MKTKSRQNEVSRGSVPDKTPSKSKTEKRSGGQADALKRTGRVIAEAGEQAEAIIRTVPNPLIILDTDLRVRLANEAFYTTFKVSRAETEGRVIFELDHGHWDIPKLRELLKDILPRHSFFNAFEVSHDFENIGHRTMLLNARTLNDTSGQPERILLGIQDITELLQFKTAMRRSELRYRRLFQASKDGVLIIDPVTGKTLDVNPFMTELLGYARDELLGKELFEIGLLKDEEASRAAFRELQEKGDIRYEDLPLQTKTGGHREVEFISNLYQEGEEKIIQCSIRDISARKKVERALAEQARLLDLSHDAIIVRDFEGRILYWNHGAEELYGWPRKEALGNAIHSLLQTEFPEPLEQITEELRQNNGWTGELVHTKRNGQRIRVLARKALDRDNQGNPAAVLVSITDITERVRMSEELRAAKDALADEASHLERLVTERTAELTTINKQLEAFAYSIAHDLRAPLRAMQGFSAMLVEEAGAALSETGRDFANRINFSAQFMDALLQELLAFSRISQERIELMPVNLETVVQSALSRLEKEMQEKNARMEISGPWPTVLAHDPTLGQVIFNLASNGLKFVRPDVLPLVRLRAEEIPGTPTLSDGERVVPQPRDPVRDAGSWVRVWVEDNGIGIAPEHQEQIFRLFARLHGDRYPGTGTGLAIVQKGMERMGGRVGLESSPGQGSRFWFELRKA